MKLNHRLFKDYQIVEVVGELSEDTAPKLKSYVQELLSSGPQNLVINLRKVPFMSSFGIAVVVYLWKRVGEKGGSMYLIGRPKFQEDIKSLNLNKIVQVFESETEFENTIETTKAAPVQFSLRKSGNFQVVVIQHINDVLVDAKTLLEELQKLVADGHKNLGVDVSRLDYLYSQFVGVFVSISKKLKPSGGELCLFGLTDDLIRSIKHVGLDQVIRTTDTGHGLIRYDD